MRVGADEMKTPPDATARAQALLDNSSRDELVVKHLDLVPRVVGRLPIAPPPGLDREDLVSAGTLGLLTAARTYQPGRGASFRTFAYTAIRAAVLDELRRHDPLPRGARRRIREVHAYEAEFRAREGRVPTPQEIADGMRVTLREVEAALDHAEQERLLRAEASGEPDPIDPVDPLGGEPLRAIEQAEDVERVEAAMHHLAPRERQVVVLYHSEGLLLKEIGELLEVTESRVSQILACAHQKIRSRLQRHRTTQGEAPQP